MKYSKLIQSCILLLALMLFTQCKKTNWYENYREKEKSPFGTYIIFNELKKLFNTDDVLYLEENINDYLIDSYEYDDEGNVIETENFANYICIKSSAYKLNKNGINQLLSFVYKGNDAFIALNYFSEELKELLEFNTNNLDEEVYDPAKLKELKGDLHIKNEEFDIQTFNFDRSLRRHYFTTLNKDKTIVLGTQKIDTEDLPVFIKIYHGKGAIYVHTQPIAFTNYFLLKDNYQYVENVFSYLSDRKILWDPQIKSSDYSPYDASDKRESVFKFFWQNPSLKWSLYVLFFGLLLFIAFNARRKQRAIPIITQLKNSTVEFTHTIANLYLKENDHKNLIDKKILFFLEKVRRNYLISTNNLNKDFIKKLALKSGNSIESANYLINKIIALNRKSECSQDELNRLNKLIENFFK